jgi:hypothetical protein
MFREMSEHEGETTFNVMMLKMRLGKQVYAAINSKSHHRSYVSRSENGIVDTILSRH